MQSHTRNLQQVFCGYCGGGNPVAGTYCTWCGRSLAPPVHGYQNAPTTQNSFYPQSPSYPPQPVQSVQPVQPVQPVQRRGCVGAVWNAIIAAVLTFIGWVLYVIFSYWIDQMLSGIGT